MVILGIDPGYAIVGYGVINKNDKTGVCSLIDYGAIETDKSEALPTRLAMIADGIKALVENYKPDAIAVEELFFNTNITTAIAVAEARGVIICTAHKLGVKISEYTPLQVKQAVVGYGRAEKKQVIAMVTSLLKLEKPPKPDDTADAVAIAICHARSSGSRLKEYFNKR